MNIFNNGGLEMDEFKNIFSGDILLVTFGGNNNPDIKRTRIKQIKGAKDNIYQEERIVNGKAFHKNIDIEGLQEYFLELMKNEFKNSVIFAGDADYYIKRSKKGKISILKKPATKAELYPKTHNKIKNYIIPEGKPVNFLIALGIMDANGKIFKKHYSKYRQINRFLELVDDEHLIFDDKDKVVITDLGCGKGYLTLALHHYFNTIKNKRTDIIGIDLKTDVIENLNSIIADLSLDGICFKAGDINDVELDYPDMVVALHACDTATDLALAKAVEAEAGLIMAVPCCQHELFNQISNSDLEPIINFGIMKDKFTELATNALRGLALEAMGYKIDMIEFTSLEHTMKNIMIRALKSSNGNPDKKKEFEDFCKYLDVLPSAAKIIVSG